VETFEKRASTTSKETRGSSVSRSSHHRAHLVPFLSEDGRAFFQERLALLGLVSGCFSLGFYAFELIRRDKSSFQCTLMERFMGVGPRAHLLACAIGLAVGFGFRTRKKLSPEFLLITDWLFVISMSVCFSLMAIGYSAWTQVREFAISPAITVLLTHTYIIISRAIFVPSRPKQTFFISATAASIGLVATWYLCSHSQWEALRGATNSFVIGNIAWYLIAICSATMASVVIFGLHTEIVRAEKLGQYVLEEKIGEGGMGIVYRARHATLRRPTALKLLPPERMGEASLRRFEREVQLTAQLSHPNTIQIYDYGRSVDGLFYYAMELLDGFDLQQIVDVTGPMPESRVVSVLVQVAGALAEAHSRGLIHRDIKPANILLCRRGGMLDVAKVVDFGLVKTIAGTVTDAPHTESGSIQTAFAGTPLYISPESLLTPNDVDGRSDIYSLGAVAYFLLTGTPPYQAQSAMEVCAMHLRAPVPPLPRSGISPELESIVARCLEKKPDQRPADCTMLRERLSSSPCQDWSEKARVAWWDAHAAKLESMRTRQKEDGRTLVVGEQRVT
jgi:serine/threonine-protein kinase